MGGFSDELLCKIKRDNVSSFDLTAAAVKCLKICGVYYVCKKFNFSILSPIKGITKVAKPALTKVSDKLTEMSSDERVEV